MFPLQGTLVMIIMIIMIIMEMILMIVGGELYNSMPVTEGFGFLIFVIVIIIMIARNPKNLISTVSADMASR